jgi:hypothetical protein
MCGAIPSLPQYMFIAWFSVKVEFFTLCILPPTPLSVRVQRIYRNNERMSFHLFCHSILWTLSWNQYGFINVTEVMMMMVVVVMVKKVNNKSNIVCWNHTM